MKNKLKLILAAAVATTIALPALAKETITFAHLSDPSIEAAMWAINNGKITSDLIEIDATAMQIPALIQATAARSYDVVMTAGMGIPRAVERGLPLRIIAAGLRASTAGEGSAIWVPKDSPIKKVEDLKGKKVAVYSLGSSGITLMRIALSDVFGMNVSLQGGDFDFVEMPAPAMPAALATGKVDAATLIHSQAFKAGQDGDFVPIVQTMQALQDKSKLQMISAVLAGYDDKLKARPEEFREFLRMIQDSRAYAVSHPDEVYTAVGKAYDVDPAFFETWFTKFMDFPGDLLPQDEKALVYMWDGAIKIGALDSYPELDNMLWKPESN